MSNKPETMMIDDVKYVRADSVQPVVYSGDETLMSRHIGEKVIVRSRNEGINIGIVVYADETGIELKNARRIWYMKPKDKGLSWYEGVAVSGLSADSKVSNIVKSKVIVEDYSITVCYDKAYAQIMEKETNAQN